MATKAELVNLLVEVRPQLNDQLALKYSAMYPLWVPGIEITQDDIDSRRDRYQYGDRLYKVVQAHTTQSDWTPDITPALWTVIDITHAGTIEDPIPAVAGMEYEYGKYYVECETIYLCQRTGEAAGGKITLYYLPSQLLGQYFSVVQ